MSASTNMTARVTTGSRTACCGPLCTAWRANPPSRSSRGGAPPTTASTGRSRAALPGRFRSVRPSGSTTTTCCWCPGCWRSFDRTYRSASSCILRSTRSSGSVHSPAPQPCSTVWPAVSWSVRRPPRMRPDSAKPCVGRAGPERDRRRRPRGRSVPDLGGLRHYRLHRCRSGDMPGGGPTPRRPRRSGVRATRSRSPRLHQGDPDPSRCAAQHPRIRRSSRVR